ncbi:hypothetical protein QR77_38385 [Streptomyces sp. 150FB]|nr:hypothetical protein QR77_38385 [Streptomyces sp. 150FB]
MSSPSAGGHPPNRGSDGTGAQTARSPELHRLVRVPFIVATDTRPTAAPPVAGQFGGGQLNHGHPRPRARHPALLAPL